MRKLYTTIFFLLCFGFCKAQWVTIPDTNFVKYLQLAFPACMNGNQMDTACFDVVDAPQITCSAWNIADLTGIQYFKNLNDIECDNNSLTVLPAFPASLVHLSCYSNKLTALPSLPASLTYLECSGNSLTALPNLPDSLTYLGCSSNRLTALPNLPASLTYLDCGYNNLTALPTLPVSLTSLDCSFNNLTALPTLSVSLTSLDCSDNGLTTLPAVPGFLTDLNCGDNALTLLPALPNSLTDLTCGDNNLTALPTLPASLYDLECSANQLTNLPALPSGLNYLTCVDNYSLTGLPALPASLKLLACYQCSLTSLPTLPDSLTGLACNENNLTVLPALPASLSSLFCSLNHLTSLPDLPPVMNLLIVYNNPAITCLPPLKQFTGENGDFDISGTGITCLPNVIQHTGSIPAIDTMPICSSVPVTINASPSSSVCTGTTVELTVVDSFASYKWSTGATTQSISGLGAGIYTVTATNTCGSTSTGSATITTTSSPIIAINPLTICAGTGGTLTANGATTYTWTPATGLSATTGSSVTANPTITTTYTVSGTNTCGTTSATSVVTVNNCSGQSRVFFGMTSQNLDAFYPGVTPSWDGPGDIIKFNPTTKQDTVVWAFGGANDGTTPWNSLTYNPDDGLYYGMTNGPFNASDSGTIISFNPKTKTENVVWRFTGYPNDGSNASGNLVYDTIRHIFYGMTNEGGSDNGGVIFSFNPVNDHEAIVVDFSTSLNNGEVSPFGGLAYDPHNDMYYGMTKYGGVNNGGAVIAFNPNTESESSVYSFPKYLGGTSPTGDLTYDPDNKMMYGMTPYGGQSGQGSIFKLTPATGDVHDVYDFRAGSPFGDLVYDGTRGVLYGMSSNYGSIISFDPVDSTENELWSFVGYPTDGAVPFGNLTYNPDNGLYYGMTSEGGSNIGAPNHYDHIGFGTIFSFDPVSHTENVVWNFQGNFNNDGSTPLLGSLSLYPPPSNAGISISSIPSLTYCQDSTVNISYSVTGAFNAGNAFNALLSDSIGSFETPVTIGTLTSTAAGTIHATIPANTSPGAGYRIRIVSTNPYAASTYNSNNITINPVPSVAVSPQSICIGKSSLLEGYGVATLYTWSPSAGLSNTIGYDVVANPTFVTTYTLTATNSCGAAKATVTVNPALNVSVNNPIICNGTSGTLTASGATTYTWTPATGLSATTGSSVTANPTITTTYTVSGTNTCGTSMAMAVVTVDTPALILPTVSGVSEQGFTLNWGTIGSANYNIVYSGASGGTINNVLPPQTISGLLNGSAYKVTVTQNSACPVTGSITTLTQYAQAPVIFGMTTGGGANGAGTIFKLDPVLHADSIIWNFGSGTDGQQPYADLVYNNSDSLFYATTAVGGTNGHGTIITFNPITDAEQVVWNFGGSGDGIFPEGNLVLNPVNGLLYGLANQGGSNNIGVIFTFNPKNKIENVVWNFGNGTDGSSPMADLAYYPANGLFYATTYHGGTNSLGTVISFNPNTNRDSVLFSFSRNYGVDPSGNLVYFPPNGLFYGMCSGGGINTSGFPSGIIFSLNPVNNTVSTVWNFAGLTSNDGANPDGSLVYSPEDGLLYGMTTSGGLGNEGTLFKFNPYTNVESAIQAFGADGAQPDGNLVYDVNTGAFFGLTSEGEFDNKGSIIRYNPLNGQVTAEWVFGNRQNDGGYPRGDIALYPGPLNANNINTGTISPLAYCAGTGVNVPFTAVGTFNAGNVFTAQLSDSKGSFSNPINIGTLNATTPGTIAATIPANTAAGTGYRIRVNSSSPATIGSDNGSDITINTKTISVNSATICDALGTAIVEAAGASAYTWAPAAGLSATTGVQVVASPSITTTYTITGTSVCGTTTATSVITVIPLISVSVNPLTICNGSGGLLTASGATTYAWTPATGLSASTGSSVTANPITTTTYTVSGTNTCGTTSATSVVTVNPLPAVSVNPLTICTGSNGILTASGATTYTWTPATALSAATGSSVTANPTITTTYTVSGTNTCGTTTATSVVTVNNLQSLSVNPLTICKGTAGPLTVTGATTYTWAPSTGLSVTTGASVTANPTVTTTYTVTGTNACGSTSATSIVTVNLLPNVGVNPLTICNGSSGPLTASGATTYNWTPANGLSATTGASVTASPTITSTYTVSGTSACGTTTAIAVVTVNNGPAAPVALAGSGATTSQITANWNVVSGGTGYFLDVSIDSSFTAFAGIYNNLNIGNVATVNVTGLSAGTTYYYRVRTTNGSCEGSNSNVIQYSTDTGSVTIIPTPTFWKQLNGPSGGINQCLFANKGIVYAGGIDGAFASSNGGVTWATRDNNIYGWNAAINGFAALGNSVFMVTDGGIYQSTNQGKTWVLNHFTLNIYFDTYSGIQSFGNKIYVSSDDSGLLASSDTGKTWQWLGQNIPNDDMVSVFSTGKRIYTWDGSTYYVSADGGNTWTTSAYFPEAYNNGKFYAGTTNGEFVSADSGVTWNALTTWPTSAQLNIAFYGNCIFVLNSNQFYSSFDNGTTWNTGQTFQYPLSYNNLVVSGDTLVEAYTYGMRWSIDSGKTWHSGNAGMCNGNVGAIGAIGGNILAVGDSGQVLISVDNGNNWSGIQSGMGRNDVYAFATAGNKIFATGTALRVSNDFGITWDSVKTYPGISFTGAIGVQGNNIYVCSTNDSAYLSTDGGTSWKSISKNFPNDEIINFAFLSDTVYAAGSKTIYASADMGETWKSLNISGVNYGAALAETGHTLMFAGQSGFGGEVVYSSNPWLGGWSTNTGLFNRGNPTLAGALNDTFYVADGYGGIYYSPDFGADWYDVTPRGFTITTFTAGNGYMYMGGSESGVWEHFSGTAPCLPLSVNSPTICRGTDSTLTVSGASSYSWAPSAGLSATTGSSVTAGPTVTTTYTVTGTGTCGTTTATSIVTVNPLPNVSVTPLTICNGNSGTLTASGATTYTWTLATGLNVTTGSSVTANPTITTTYTVSGTNSCGTTTATSVVTVNPLPNVSVNSLNTCAGTGGTLTATGATTYSWTPSIGLSATTGASVTANPTINTTYTVSGTNSCGTTTATSVVTVNPLPNVSVNSLNTCAGTGGTLTATGATTYSWTPLIGLSATTGASVTANPTINTTYTVSGTNSCGTTTATSVVTVNPLPNVSVNSLNTCAGTGGTLTANGATTYTWTPATGLSATTGAAVSASPTINTTYTVSGTNTCGTTTATSVITVNPVPSAATATAGSGATTTQITANWNSVPGATGYFLDVSTDAGFGSFVSGYNNLSVGNVLMQNVTGLSSGITYFYRVRASNGNCTGTNSNTISYATSSGVSCPFTGGTITTPYIIICSGSTILLTDNGSTGDDYQWQISPDNANWSDITGATTTGYTTASSDGNSTKYYRLMSKSATCGDVTSNTAEVDVSNPNITVTATNITDNSVTLSWSPTGSGNYNISYSGASIGTAPAVTPAKTLTGLISGGAYNITVTQTGVAGCAASGAITLSTLCAVPDGVTLSSPAPAQIQVSWTGTPGADYRVYYRPLFSYNTYFSVDVSNVSSVLLTKQGTNNLFASTTYEVYVAQLNCPTAGAVGQPTSPANVTTLPTVTCATPAIDSVRSLCPVQIEVFIHNNGVNTYNVFVQRITPSILAVNTYAVSGTYFTINVPYSGDQYLIAVQAKCGSTLSAMYIWPGNITVKPLCDAPANLILSNPTCHGFTASWNADECVSNSASQYVLYLRAAGVINYNSYAVALPTNDVNPNKLINFVASAGTYQVFVRTVYNCNGFVTYGPSSQIQTMQTLSLGCRDEDAGQPEETKPAIQQYSTDNQEAFSLYPNPNTGEFIIDLSRLNTDDESVRIEVLNMLGQTVLTQLTNISNGHLNEFINLPNGTSAGMYVVRVIAGKNIYTTKVNVSR